MQSQFPHGEMQGSFFEVFADGLERWCSFGQSRVPPWRTLHGQIELTALRINARYALKKFALGPITAS